MNVILVGPPGAGKGTQARSLALFLDVPHISSGDLFRAMLKEDTPLAREIKAYIDQGHLVPDDMTIRMLLERISRDDCKNGVLLDGFPRSVPQAAALDVALANTGAMVDLVLHMRASREVVLKRMSNRLTCPNCGAVYNSETRPPRVPTICDRCGHVLARRADEEIETLGRRIEVYESQTAPILDYYGQQKKVRTVNAELPFLDVKRAIEATVAAARSVQNATAVMPLEPIRHDRTERSVTETPQSSVLSEQDGSDAR